MLSEIEAIRKKKYKNTVPDMSLPSMETPTDLAQLSKESVILKQINRNYPNWNAKEEKEWKKGEGGEQSIRQLWEDNIKWSLRYIELEQNEEDKKCLKK